jgi:hypothetical protein
MKKILSVILLVTISNTVLADGRFDHHGSYGRGYHGLRAIHQDHYYHNGYGANDILVPMVIGGIVGYVIRERTQYNSQKPIVIQQQPQVIYQQPQTIYQSCTAWVETLDHFGNVTRTRTCY